MILPAATIAIRTLRRQPLRAALMMLGVTAGVGALTGVWSLNAATKQAALETMRRSVGSIDTLIVHPGPPRTNNLRAMLAAATALSLDDFRAIALEVPGIRQAVAAQTIPSVTVKYRNLEASPSVYGVSRGWSAIRGERFSTGAPIDAADQDTSARVVVLGADVKAALFGDAEAVGETIRVADVPFVVKGVTMPAGASLGQTGSQDNKIFIPLSTSSRRVINSNYLALILVQMRDPTDSAQATDAVATLLRRRHHITPPADDDFSVTTPRVAAERVTGVDQTLSRVLGGVAAVSMAIGGVVIMTMMLVAVSQRRAEIGLRRAVGATRRDILVQFLVETMMVSVVGGATGIVAGFGVTRALVELGDLPMVPDPTVVAGTTAVAVALGLIFGVYPAWRASTVDPIDALRS